MSGYKTAIACTTRTVDNRAKYFRNLIVAVVALSIGCIGWSAIGWTLSPLAGLSLLFPLCGLFFFLDGKLLDVWRSHVLQAWIKNEIELQSFRASVSAIPILPKNTVASMLATLPVAGDLIAERGMSSSSREAMATQVMNIHTCQSDIVALKAAMAAIVAGSIIGAIARHAWEPLLCIFAILVPSALVTRLKRRQIREQKDHKK